MQEIVTIAGLKGIVLPANIIDLTFQKASTFPYHTPTSLQLDVHSKRQNNELELFAGAIIRYGEEVKASTVATGRVYEEIKNLGLLANQLIRCKSDRWTVVFLFKNPEIVL